MSVLVLALWAPGRAVAQSETWDVDEAVKRALANPAFAALLESRLSVTRASMAEALTLPAPTLGLGHEQVFGDAGYFETSLHVEQELDVTTWRSRRRAALAYQEEAQRLSAEDQELQVAAAVRAAFFEARYREERIRALDAWLLHLEQGLSSVRAREGSGDESGYTVRRIGRDLEIARAQRALEGSLLAEAMAGLRRWSPWETPPVLTGPLRPADEVAATVALPELRRLEQRHLELQAEAEVWGDPLWRGWTVGAGYRLAGAGEAVGHGFMVTFSMPLALWNVDQPRLERLRAEQTQTESELALARALVGQAEDSAVQRLRDALGAVAELPSSAEDVELTRMAEVAYGAGEATLTELLDAYQSEAELRLSRTDLEWEARRAALEVERRRGQGVPHE